MRVFSAAVTPDGQRVVTLSTDQTLRVWDLTTGQCVALFAPSTMLSACCLCSYEGLLCAGDVKGEMVFLQLSGIPGIPAKSTTNSATNAIGAVENYVSLLGRGLDFSCRENGVVHDESVAYLAALAIYLNKMGNTKGAKAFADSRDRLDHLLATRKAREQEEARQNLRDCFDV